MKTLAGWAFLAAAATGLFAQGEPHATGLKAAPRTLTILLRNRWTALDQVSSYDIGTDFIIGNLYESLIAFDGRPDKFIAWLSEAVPTRENGLLSADGLLYRFPIRKGVLFHDGSPLSLEDVRYSILRELIIQGNHRPPSFLLKPFFGLSSNVDSGGRWAVPPEAMERAVRVDGEAVVLTLQKPFPGFLKLLGSLPVVTSKAWTTAHGGWNGTLPAMGGEQPAETGDYLLEHANGTGPFMIESAAAGVRLVLKPHPRYWGAAPKVDRVVFRAEPSDPLRASQLSNGDADYVYLERATLPLVQGHEGVTVVDDIPTFTSGETIFFTFNVDATDNPRLGSGRLDGRGIPPDFFKDKDVRLAFTYAFSASTYAQIALNNKGTPAYGPIPPSLLPQDRLKGAAPAYDLGKAKAAFKRAHNGDVWKNGFTVPVSYMRGNVRRQIAAEVLKAGVESVNPKFRVELEAVAPKDYPAYYEAHRLPLWVQELVCDYPDPHSLAFPFFHSRGFFAGAQGASFPELDALEERAADEPDPAKRTDLFLELETKALQDALQIYTYHPVQFKAVRSWLKGLDANHAVNGLSFSNLLYLAPIEKSTTGPHQP